MKPSAELSNAIVAHDAFMDHSRTSEQDYRFALRQLAVRNDLTKAWGAAIQREQFESRDRLGA